MTAELAQRYRVVSYDVRGAGKSGKPRNRAAYRLYQLAISGPCLDHVGHWLRARLRRPTPRVLRELITQLVASWYSCPGWGYPVPGRPMSRCKSLHG